MNKKIIKDKVPVPMELKWKLTDGKVTDVIVEFQKLIEKYGPTLTVDINCEDDYGGYIVVVEMEYEREETDKEFQTRKNRIEAAHKSKVKGDATKKANKEVSDKETLERLKKSHPHWF